MIRRVHAENYGVYGVRKMHAELNRRGHRIARCTVHRLMRSDGLHGISRAKGPRTTIPGKGPDTRPDLLDRDFQAPAPNRVWVADITYCRTFAGWVYAAFVVDVYSRRVVGWQLSRSLRTDLALDALEMGLWTRAHAGQDTTGVIAHSDKGVQPRFNRSKQHPDRGGVDGTAARVDGHADGTPSPEVAWTTADSSRGRAGVLAQDRGGLEQRGCRDRGRRVGPGRFEMVPRAWRHAVDQPRGAFGPVPVVQ